MPQCKARLKPMDSSLYPHLNPYRWYDVCPLFPGVTQRTMNVSGERLTRIETPHGYTTVKSAHFEFAQETES